MMFGAGSSGPGQDIRAGLVVDQTQFQAQLSQIDARTSAVDQKIAATRTRGEAVISRLRVAEAQVGQLSAMSSPVMSRASKFARKAAYGTAVSYVAGEITSEIGIPEAAQPATHIGTAALMGLSFGPGTAVGFAALATIRELWSSIKKTKEDAERLMVEVFKNKEKQERVNKEMEKIAAEWAKKLEEGSEKAKRDAVKESSERGREELRALYQPEY